MAKEGLWRLLIFSPMLEQGRGERGYYHPLFFPQRGKFVDDAGMGSLDLL